MRSRNISELFLGMSGSRHGLGGTAKPFSNFYFRPASEGKVPLGHIHTYSRMTQVLHIVRRKLAYTALHTAPLEKIEYHQSSFLGKIRAEPAGTVAGLSETSPHTRNILEAMKESLSLSASFITSFWGYLDSGLPNTATDLRLEFLAKIVHLS